MNKNDAVAKVLETVFDIQCSELNRLSRALANAKDASDYTQCLIDRIDSLALSVASSVDCTDDVLEVIAYCNALSVLPSHSIATCGALFRRIVRTFCTGDVLGQLQRYAADDFQTIRGTIARLICECGTASERV